MIRANFISTIAIFLFVFGFLFIAIPHNSYSGVSQLGCCLNEAILECENCEGTCASLLEECNVGFLHNSYCGPDGGSCVIAQESDLGCCVRPDNLCVGSAELEQCEIYDGVEWVFDTSCSDVPQCPMQDRTTEFFTDKELFEDTCTDLNFEDFENSNVPDNNSQSCPNPFNTFTNNACYSPGVLIPGFSVLAEDPPNPALALLVLAPGALGVPSTVVGPDSAINPTIVELDDANAAGIEFLLLNPGAIVNNVVAVDVYGPGNQFLGTQGIQVDDNSIHFVGVISGINSIDRIEITAPFNLQLISTLSFGKCNVITREVPALSEWGLIAIAGILGVIAFVVIRRKSIIA